MIRGGAECADNCSVRPPAPVPPVAAQRFPHMVTAVITEIQREPEPVSEDSFDAVASTDPARATILARIAVLFGSDEPRRAIVD